MNVKTSGFGLLSRKRESCDPLCSAECAGGSSATHCPPSVSGPAKHTVPEAKLTCVLVNQLFVRVTLATAPCQRAMPGDIQCWRCGSATNNAVSGSLQSEWRNNTRLSTWKKIHCEWTAAAPWQLQNPVPAPAHMVSTRPRDRSSINDGAKLALRRTYCPSASCLTTNTTRNTQ